MHMKKFLVLLFLSFTCLSCIYENPQWTPDGKKLICGVFYDDANGDDQYQFFSVDLTSKKAVPLTQFIESKSGVAPSLSPDGSQIAYFFHEESMGEKRMDLHVMNVDGSADRPLLELAKEEDRAEYTLKPWNPDGKTLAVQNFNSQKSAYEILLVDLKGSKRTLSGLQSFVLPSWSPDGKFLAYLVKKEKTYDLVVTEPDSLESKTLAKDIPLPVKRNKELLPFLVPAWSSDGKTIAYVNDHQIAMIDVETTRRKDITQGKGFKVYPQWSKAPQSSF
jgi:Tol biopolymer transport system component